MELRTWESLMSLSSEMEEKFKELVAGGDGEA